MSDELISYLKKYIIDTIYGFESGLYKMVTKTSPDKIKLMASNHEPFITIFREIHEKYYTSTFNSIIKKDDPYVVKIFGDIRRMTNHSHQCMLNILSNIIVPIHFNFNRKELNWNNYDLYMASIKKQIETSLSLFDMKKLFEHECHGPTDDKLIPLKEGEKFINIALSKN